MNSEGAGRIVELPQSQNMFPQRKNGNYEKKINNLKSVIFPEMHPYMKYIWLIDYMRRFIYLTDRHTYLYRIFYKLFVLSLAETLSE